MANEKKLASTKKERVLFEIKHHVKKVISPENFPFIKCAPGEKVLCVQRQHPIVLLASLSLPIIGALAILLCILLIARFSPVFFFSYTLSPMVIFFIILTITSGLLVIETFNFMTWYYQFYIITNKSILHKHFFTIGGFYSEVIFLEEIHQQEIIRQPPNFIYDFLKIQDVYVYFHKLEREEPFVFKTPDNAQVIEDLLQDLTIEHGIARGPI